MTGPSQLPTRDSNEHQPADAPDAAVFDCDGLLIESAGCWRLAYQRVLATGGRSLDTEFLVALNGASVPQAARTLRVAAEVLHAELRAAFATNPLAACRGARTLISELYARVPMAVATNGPAEVVALALKRVGLLRYLPVIISADTHTEKPAPDVYLEACARLGVRPGRAVAFEDSPIGAAAAQAAGLRLVYVPSAERGDVRPDIEVQRLDDEEVLAAFCCKSTSLR